MRFSVSNVTITNLEDAILASGFPMQTDFDADEYERKKTLLFTHIKLKEKSGLAENDINWCEKQLKRVRALGTCDGGESHDCFLCGITVQFNVTAPRYWFPEEQRYHFADIISSFSTMHCLKRNVRQMIVQPASIADFFSDKTDERVVKVFLEVASEIFEDDSKSDDDKIEYLKAILPEGYMQTCRITTNYRQLKTWVRQRENHRLSIWREMCEWIRGLPLFGELTGMK